jgi:hypothetical protein
MHNRLTIRTVLAAFKGNIYQKHTGILYIPELSYHTPKKYLNLRGYLTKNVRACGVIDTAFTIFAFENRSYLGEFEAEFKKALARESGAQGVLFDEKNKRPKILWHCPF